MNASEFVSGNRTEKKSNNTLHGLETGGSPGQAPVEPAKVKA